MASSNVPTNASTIVSNVSADISTTAAKETARMMRLIEKIVAECPRRLATSDSERHAQSILESALQQEGLSTHSETFQFNESLYANIALHFGAGAAANIIGQFVPAVSTFVSTFVAGSYWSDSTRRGYVLRRLLPWKESQNLLGISPAKSGTPTVRIVLIAHADAAFTGWLFDPAFIKQTMHSPLPDNLGFLQRIMEVATASQLALAGVDAIRAFQGRKGKQDWLLRALLTAPALAVAITNLQIVLRNEVVPGANDNLTGCAALPILAARLLKDQPEDVELVFAVAGAEEASLGGSDALAMAHLHDWNPENTVILAIDTLSGGDIRFVEREGEIQPVSIAPRLRHCLQRAAATDERFRTVRGLDVPIGGTDALPFARRGYQASTITCVDPEIGAARHYHMPSDIPDNIDQTRLLESVDFIEAAVREIIHDYTF